MAQDRAVCVDLDLEPVLEAASAIDRAIGLGIRGEENLARTAKQQDASAEASIRLGVFGVAQVSALVDRVGRKI